MSEKPDPNALAVVLIAELHRVGMFDHGNLDMIARRLEQSGEPDMAARVRALPLSNALTDPDAMRAGIYSISGGKSDPD